jgi:hypothetical protein
MAKPGNQHRDPKQSGKTKRQWTRMDALTVREYEGDDGETKSAFSRVGVAFVGDDGNITVQLDSLPVSGKLLIRHPLPPREE